MYFLQFLTIINYILDFFAVIFQFEFFKICRRQTNTHIFMKNFFDIVLCINNLNHIMDKF